MDTVTYPHPGVRAALDEGYVGTRLELGANEETARQLNVAWTPGLLVLDPSERIHYRAYGYYPPEEFRQFLGTARGVAEIHRGNFKDAIAAFSRVAEEGAQTSFQPEALYWLGVSYYRCGDREALMKVWNALLDKHPTNLWAKKVSFIRG